MWFVVHADRCACKLKVTILLPALKNDLSWCSDSPNQLSEQKHVGRFWCTLPESVTLKFALQQPFRGRLQTIFFRTNVIVTLIKLEPFPPPNVHGDHRCFSLATALVSPIIALDELLILSCWMIVNCTYFLLKHGGKVSSVLTFCWQTKCHVASLLLP